jgi:hypothetical protein
MSIRVDEGIAREIVNRVNTAERQVEAIEKTVELTARKVAEMALGGLLARQRVQESSNNFAPTINVTIPQTFTNDKPNIPRNTEPKPPGPDATPAEAAAFIDFYRAGAGYQSADGFMFMRQLMEHQNDAAWIQGYFQALGTERMAELINKGLSYETFQNWTKRSDINEFVGALRNSFATLDKAGLLNQEDMNKLVGSWASSGNFNPQTAIEIFGKLSYEHENLKSMFFQAAASQATNPKVDKDLAKTLAAAATHVLGSTSSDNQVLQLDNFCQSGNLEQLIQRAMAGTRQVSSLDSMAAYYDDKGVTEENYGKVESLLYSVAYHDVRDGWDRGQAIPSDNLRTLRTTIFNTAAQTLTDSNVFKNFKNNQTFKDGLSAVFMQEFDAIITSGLGPNGAGFDILKFQPGMEKFFQLTLFSPPLGYTSQQLSNFISGRISETGAALLDNSAGAEEKFRAEHGRSRMDGAAIAGGLLGMLTDGLKASKDALKKDAEAQAQAVKLVLDIAFGFIPGIGSRLGDTAAEQFLKNIIGPLDNKIRDSIKNRAVDKAKELIMSQYKEKLGDLNPEQMVLALFNSLNQTIPNGDNRGEQNFRAEFNSSYSTIVNSPNKIVSE